MIGAKRHLQILVLLCLLAVLVYANSLHNPFIIDDHHIIVRNWLLREQTPWPIFKSHLFASQGIETEYYRPLTLFTFWINYRISGLNPVGYHATNLSLHVIVVTLAYILLSQFVSPAIAGFSSAFFAVHPANVQAVTYISSRSDPLYSLCILLGLLSWRSGTAATGSKRIFFQGSSLALYFLALSSKEMALVMLLLVLLTDWMWPIHQTARETFKRNWIWYAGLGTVFVIYLAVRGLFAGYGLTMENSKVAWTLASTLGLAERIFLALKLFWLYVGLIFYPANLSFFRSVELPTGFFDIAVLSGLGTLALLIMAAYFSWTRQKEVCYGILWFLITIVLVLNLTPLNAPMMEHWLYLPLIGFLLATVGCIFRFAQMIGERRGTAAALAFLFLILSIKTFSRNREWGDPVTLFLNDAQRQPRAEKNWFLLGYAYAERGQANQAVEAYRAGLAINSNNAQGWSGLGEALSMLGQSKEAEKSFVSAISLNPWNPWFHYVLGLQRIREDKIDLAIETLEQAGRLTPRLPLVYHVLGSAYLRQGREKEAETAFRKALSLLPPDNEIHAGIHIELGKIYVRQGKMGSALQEWRLALRFDPNSEAKSLLEDEGKHFQVKKP